MKKATSLWEQETKLQKESATKTETDPINKDVEQGIHYEKQTGSRTIDDPVDTVADTPNTTNTAHTADAPGNDTINETSNHINPNNTKTANNPNNPNNQNNANTSSAHAANSSNTPNDPNSQNTTAADATDAPNAPDATSTTETTTDAPDSTAAAKASDDIIVYAPDGTSNTTNTTTTTRTTTTSTESEARTAALLKACGIDETHLNSSTISKNLSELEPFIEDEKQIKKPLLLVLLMWCIVSCFAILRANVEGCSAGYWVITMFVFPFLLLLTYFLSKRQVQSYNKKLALGWKPCPGDVEWISYKQALTYASVAGVAGVLGGLLGIGGGMIVSPLLLELQVLPRVASATSAIAVLVTSSSATLQFILLDMLSFDYMLFFMSVGVIGTYVGQTLINRAIKKYGRNSVVIFAVGTVIAMAVFFHGNQWNR